MSYPSHEFLSNLIEQLADDVLEADAASFEVRQSLTREWLANPVVLDLIIHGLAHFETEVRGQIELLAVGLAGLARTLHVSANQELMPISEAEEQGKFPQVDRAIANINLANSVHDRIGTDDLPPWTIHSYNPIDWASERAQDQGASFSKLGKPDQAHEVLTVALIRTSATLERMAAQGLPDLSDRSTDNKAELRRRNSYLGKLSAKAVLQYRLARLEKSIEKMKEALVTLNQSETLYSNPDRLAVVTKVAGKALFEKEFQGSIAHRVQLGVLVVYSLGRVLFSKIRSK